MKRKVIDLDILENLAESGVSVLSLVDRPAIEIEWRAFKDQKFVEPNAGESEDDFLGRCIPILLDEGKDQDQAVAICYSMYENMSSQKFADYPWDECIADQEGRGLDEESAKAVCGWIKANMSYDTSNLPVYVDEVTEDKDKKKISIEFNEELDIYGYKTRFFYICPLAYKTFQHFVDSDLDEDTIGMVRSAAVVADRIFQIEKEVVEAEHTTTDQMREALVLIDDFYDIIEELDKIMGMVHDVSYMDNHAEIIADYYTPETEEVALESYTDYPEGAVNNAKRALDWKEKNGSDCGTPIGWTRARQLANREPISMDTIARMASFERHRQNSETPYTEGCGGIMWDAWGGDSGIRWAQTKIKELQATQQFAAVEDLRVGDAVSWKTADQNPRGRIREIIRNGGKTVPGTSFVLQGSPEDPGYIIEIYEKKNGKWEPTGKFAGRKADSILKNVELWRQVFASQDEQIIVGPALVPDKKIYRKDDDKSPAYDVRFSKEAIARIAEKFMRELRGQNTNIQHEEDRAGKTYVMESWIVENLEDKANTVYGLDVPVGTWVVKGRVTDPNIWKMVKEGKLTGWSVEGSFLDAAEVQSLKNDRDLYTKIVKILNEK